MKTPPWGTGGSGGDRVGRTGQDSWSPVGRLGSREVMVWVGLRWCSWLGVLKYIEGRASQAWLLS